MAKAYFIMRKDLGMSPGKLAVQVGHGTDYIHINQTKDYGQWMAQGRRKKIVTEVKDQVELIEIVTLLRDRKVKFNEIWDAGLTELNGTTFTGLVILPIEDEELPGRIKFLPKWKDNKPKVEETK